MKRSDKLLHIYAYITLTITWSVLLFIAYTIFWPFNPVTFTDDSFSIRNKEVNAGDHVEILSSYCKNITTRTEVVYKLSEYGDGETAEQTEYTRVLSPEGCVNNFVDKTFIVSNEIHPGKYYLDLEITMYIYPWREVTLHKKTEPFDVI